MPDKIHWQAPATSARSNGTPFDNVALVLQGGGALGAYQAGVYEALLERGIEPGWISGISIGAINSAIIAGTPRETRVARLREFWNLVSAHSISWAWAFPMVAEHTMLRGFINRFAASDIMAGGVPAFFSPRVPPAPLHMPGTVDATSWYDTSALKGTLERLVDFDRINARETRFSVGAVNVRTGNFVYFDNATHHIRAEHIMASGALPPGFPAVEVDGEHYWDGGLVSNTPLDWVLSARSNLDTLVFQVDLWSASGELPTDLLSVAVRAKEIQYSSRTRAATDTFHDQQLLRAAFRRLLDKMPPELAASDEARLLAKAADSARYSIVQLIYHSPNWEGESKDYEFSRQSMEDHWRKGYQQAHHTLDQPEVLRLPDNAAGLLIHDFTSPHGAPPAPAKSRKDVT